MNPEEEKILNKIKKLFALSESPNEKEAASALNKAKVLLAKYGLEHSPLEGPSVNLTERELVRNTDIHDWQIKLIECIGESTYTEAIIESFEKERRIVIIGRRANVLSAVNLYKYL